VVHSSSIIKKVGVSGDVEGITPTDKEPTATDKAPANSDGDIIDQTATSPITDF
jgi:hypothetical protein